MNLTLREKLEKILRKYYPTISLHAVKDYSTQLGALDAQGIFTRKTELEIILMLCQHVQELEEKVDLVITEYGKPTTTTKEHNTKTAV